MFPTEVIFTRFYAERGVVWEETIILLPDNVHYVFLSATIPNARQFAEWISFLHKQVRGKLKKNASIVKCVSRGRKTWRECVKDETVKLVLRSEWTVFRDMWRGLISGENV